MWQSFGFVAAFLIGIGVAHMSDSEQLKVQVCVCVCVAYMCVGLLGSVAWHVWVGVRVARSRYCGSCAP